MCGLTPEEFGKMTPAEFKVLLDARAKNVRDGYDFFDSVNAQLCRFTLRIPEAELRVFKLIQPKVEEQPADNTVDVFKQWVSATGGETI